MSNIQMKRKNGEAWEALYPFTKIENVKDLANNKSLVDIIAGIESNESAAKTSLVNAINTLKGSSLDGSVPWSTIASEVGSIEIPKVHVFPPIPEGGYSNYFIYEEIWGDGTPYYMLYKFDTWSEHLKDGERNKVPLGHWRCYRVKQGDTDSWGSEWSYGNGDTIAFYGDIVDGNVTIGSQDGSVFFKHTIKVEDIKQDIVTALNALGISSITVESSWEDINNTIKTLEVPPPSYPTFPSDFGNYEYATICKTGFPGGITLVISEKPFTMANSDSLENITSNYKFYQLKNDEWVHFPYSSSEIRLSVDLKSFTYSSHDILHEDGSIFFKATLTLEGIKKDIVTALNTLGVDSITIESTWDDINNAIRAIKVAQPKIPTFDLSKYDYKPTEISIRDFYMQNFKYTYPLEYTSPSKDNAKCLILYGANEPINIYRDNTEDYLMREIIATDVYIAHSSGFKKSTSEYISKGVTEYNIINTDSVKQSIVDLGIENITEGSSWEDIIKAIGGLVKGSEPETETIQPQNITFSSDVTKGYASADLSIEEGIKELGPIYVNGEENKLKPPIPLNNYDELFAKLGADESYLNDYGFSRAYMEGDDFISIYQDKENPDRFYFAKDNGYELLYDTESGMMKSSNTNGQNLDGYTLYDRISKAFGSTIGNGYANAHTNVIDTNTCVLIFSNYDIHYYDVNASGRKSENVYFEDRMKPPQPEYPEFVNFHFTAYDNYYVIALQSGKPTLFHTNQRLMKWDDNGKIKLELTQTGKYYTYIIENGAWKKIDSCNEIKEKWSITVNSIDEIYKSNHDIISEYGSMYFKANI